MTWLLIAGGFAVASPQIQFPDLYNHTLAGERIVARQVVCRNRWGTPMLPDGKGGYSLIAPINQEYIAQSLIQPPRTTGPVFRPQPVSEVVEITPAPPAPSTPPAPTTAPAPVPPPESSQPPEPAPATSPELPQ